MLLQTVLFKNPLARRICLHNIPTWTFTVLLNYIYAGTLDLTGRTIGEFLEVLNGAAYLGVQEVSITRWRFHPGNVSKV